MKKAAFFIFIIQIITVSTLLAQNVTQWRGLNRSGHYPDQQLADKWDQGGPELLLNIEGLPESYSSVVVHNNVIYTSGIQDEKEFLSAIDLKGNILWNTPYGDAWTKSYSPARCTPTIDGDIAYVISGSGDLTTMVAIDKSNGETIWQSESIQDQSGYTSPIYIERDNLNQIITVIGNHVLGVDAVNGSIIWKFNYTAIEKPMMGEDINPVTPLIKGDEIFVTSGYNHVGIMLKMINNYSEVELKWVSKDLDVHHGGVVEVDGYIYGSNYTSIRSGNWLCLDWETGKVMYDQKWNTKGQIIYSDGKLICYDERRGNIALVKAGPEQFEILSEFKMPFGTGPHWSHPSIYDNVLYLRHGKSLVSYKIGI